MLANIKRFFAWNQAQRRKDEASIRADIKALWPWYLPMWIFPVVFASDCFLNGMPEERAITHGVIPFGVCALIATIPVLKKPVGTKGIQVVYYLIPLSVFLLACIIWAWIHDTYMK
jgi:hypothetical protein